jgi:WD40-like Beta Propeller Repeat
VKRALILLALMVASGLVANRAIAAFQTRVGSGSLVDATVPQVTLPGTIYVSQSGEIYAINGADVRRLPLPSGGSWIQPRVLPDGSLLVVRRFDAYSDLYHVSAAGAVLQQLSNDDLSRGNSTLQLDHWILWPAISPDGSTVYFATDSPKPAPGSSYEVDFALWSAPLHTQIAIGDNGVSNGTQWSTPDRYTGGDIQPVPLPDGNVLYASYANPGTGSIASVLGLQTSAGSPMQTLTSVQQDCGSPAVAADGVTVAMVCSHGGQSADIEVATLNGTTLSALHVVVAKCLCNSPSWSPSGDDLLYMGATDANGFFGLWYVAQASGAHPGAPERVTNASVDLDATSAAAWTSGG